MISFELGEEQHVARDAMREFSERAMRPIARECDETSCIPNDFLEDAWPLGLTSTQIPEEYGGAGERSPITNAILLEELTSGDAALTLAALAPSAFVNAIIDQGSKAQKAQYLPAFCGKKFITSALASIEPFAMADPATPVRWPKKGKADLSFRVVKALCHSVTAPQIFWSSPATAARWTPSSSHGTSTASASRNRNSTWE